MTYSHATLRHFHSLLDPNVGLQTIIYVLVNCNTHIIAPDKAAYCVYTQFRGPENAIKLIFVRTKTQYKSLILNSELFRSV